jgi:hypothetical protein
MRRCRAIIRCCALPNAVAGVDAALARLFRASERIGFTLTVVCVVGWFVCEVIVIRAVADASLQWQIPMLGLVVEFLLFSLAAISGLVSFWLLAKHIRYVRRGYRVKWTSANEWLYEERVSRIDERTLPYVRVIVGKGYPAPCEISIISAESWDLDAPLWARGRRGEVIQRVSNCHGGDRGGNIRFLDRVTRL